MKLGARALLLCATVAAIGVGVGVPLALLIQVVLRHPEAWARVTEPAALAAARNTAVLAGGTTTFALLVGVPLGVLLGRGSVPGASRWVALATVPYVVPPYVTAIAWIALLNPTTGWVNQLLRSAGLPVLDIYGLPGMIWILGLETTPLVLLATAEALGRMDASLEEQARVAGARPWQVIRRVTLPLSAPAIVAAAAAVLASSASAFGVPYLLASGAARPDWVLTTRIAQQLDLDPAAGRPVAVALAVVLLGLSSILPALGYAWLARRSFTTVTGKATRQAPLSLGRWRPVGVALVAGYVLLGAVLPIGVLLALSVTDDLARLPGPDNATLAAYAEVLGRARDRGALIRSAWVSAGAATVAVAVGALVAILEAPGARAGRVGWLGWVVRLPYTVPGTVLALGLLLTWSQPVRIVVAERVTVTLLLADTAWLLLVAYAVKFVALPMGTLGAALRSIDASLEEAARVAGASWFGTIRRVTVPLLLPSLAAGWFMVFLPSFTEVTMSVLLAGPRNRVAGVLLFDLQTYGDPPAAAALGVVVAAVVLCGHAIVLRLGRAAA